MDIEKIIEEQLGENFKLVKMYNAFENGELRIIVKNNQGFEYRYIFQNGQLIKKP